jgi:Serine dehydrogenase proteinase
VAKHKKPKTYFLKSRPTEPRIVDSLIDSLEDGNEYGSIVGLAPRPDLDLISEVLKGLSQIEQLRSRPCLSYVGNVVRPEAPDSGIDSTDDLPFLEMVNQVPQDVDSIDIFLATRGGSGHQVSRFVNCLRSRFNEVDFLIPSFCMSAGTLFALSGDRIWMTPRACLGPIDPQVPTIDGRYVPAQALLLLVNQLQMEGDEAMKKGQPVPWTAVRIIDSLDKKELGDALTASTYSSTMASQFLQNYKFKGWITREVSGLSVTPEY